VFVCLPYHFANWRHNCGWHFYLSFCTKSINGILLNLKWEVLINLTFCGPCIVIYAYNRIQQDAQFLDFILIYNSTCFGQTYCPSSGVLILYSQQLVFVILVIKIKLRSSASCLFLLYEVLISVVSFWVVEFTVITLRDEIRF